MVASNYMDSLLKLASPNPIMVSESKFNEIEPRLKSAKNRFQLSAGLNLKTTNTILNWTNYI